MVLVHLADGGSNILIKISLARGLNQLAFVIYRHVFVRFLSFSPRKNLQSRNQRSPLSFPVMLKIFVLAFFGTTIHLNVYYAGLHHTSPVVASALSNVLPSLTFLGALLPVFTFWKGEYLMKSFVERPLINIYNTKESELNRHGKENWIKGSKMSTAT
ncbi:WAT1-related protein [Melia azedarach]|uniref:WAT1-related protein n=1 Tax=Melia azedarach TaxID=155640 RepID=A0ACC1XKS7_MELAZ|nr:WAT1-related protein [Melia azedarach]